MRIFNETPKPIISSLNQIRATYDGEDIWILDNGWNAIFKADKELENIQLIISLPNHIMASDNYFFERIIKVDRKLFLIPCKANGIYVLNLKDMVIKRLDIIFESKVLNVIPINIKEYLVFISRNPDIVIKYNILSEEIKKFDVDNNSETEKSIMRARYRTNVKLDVNGEQVIIPYLVKDKITYFNAISGTFYSKHLGVDIGDDFIVGCNKIGINKYVYYSSKGKLVFCDNDKINVDNRVIDTINNLESESIPSRDNVMILVVHYLHDCLFCIFENLKSVIALDLKSDSIFTINNPYIKHINEKQLGTMQYYTDSISTNEKIYIWSEKGAHLVFGLNLKIKQIEMVEAKWEMNLKAKKELILRGKSVILKDDLKGLIDVLCCN